MALKVLNPIFAAMQYATISCITIGITMLLASEIAEANGETGAYPAVLGFILWMMVTPTSFAAKDLSASFIDKAGKSHGYTLGDFINVTGAAAKHKITADSFTYSGILSNYTAATGLFTGLIVAIVGMELYNMFRKNDSLKIKMPEQVPPGVARAFEVLIPTCLTAIVVGAVGLVCQLATGAELNAFIFNVVQKPLQSLIGNNIFAVAILYVIISLFWCVGIHGNNMLSAVKEALFTPLALENVEKFNKGEKPTNIINMYFLQMCGEFGGSGVTIGLVIAIMIFGKREDNKAIASLSLIPGLFEINETVTFGIPFVLTSIVLEIVGYVLTVIGFCPVACLTVPWTCPPLIFGFLATGANIMGAVTQAILIAISVVIYTPFLISYEKYQNKQAAEA